MDEHDQTVKMSGVPDPGRRNCRTRTETQTPAIVFEIRHSPEKVPATFFAVGILRSSLTGHMDNFG